jgi:CubicO group peptidase (beta-lactamase class C family)
VVQAEHLPGLAMAVVENGQVVYRHAEGARGDGGRIDEDTLFKIASNSKAMTAALLARLVQQGSCAGMIRCSGICRASACTMHGWSQQMQVRDLLIHNSGLGLGAGDLMLWPEPNAFTRADIIAGLGAPEAGQQLPQPLRLRQPDVRGGRRSGGGGRWQAV